MWALTLLKHWKEALIAFFAFAAGIFWLLFKSYKAKNKKLKHEMRVKDKVSEIAEKHELIKAKLLDDEQDEILKKVNDNAKKSNIDRANSL